MLLRFVISIFCTFSGAVLICTAAGIPAIAVVHKAYTRQRLARFSHSPRLWLFTALPSAAVMYFLDRYSSNAG